MRWLITNRNIEGDGFGTQQAISPTGLSKLRAFHWTRLARGNSKLPIRSSNS